MTDKTARLFHDRTGRLRHAAVGGRRVECYLQKAVEFQCCYYTCNGLVFNAIGEDYIFEIYELAQEIAAPPTIPLPVERKITTKEEYRETWFNL